MNPTYFSSKKSLQIVSHQIKNDIKTLISNIGSFNLTSKYYTFLNKKNVNNLKESNFLVTLSTFGKKFVLFITKYNTKKYCIFINKKNDSMIVTQLKFTDDVFLGTLFDGELIKNENDKWIYLINDIAYYKNENIVTKSFLERQSIIDNILKNEHENNYIDTNQSFYISKKTYFEYKNIKDLSENYVKYLNYKCSGLYFKNINNFSDNYLFIFPECRSDSKILNNGVCFDNTSVKNVLDDDDDLFSNVELIDEQINGKQVNNKQFNDKHVNDKQFNDKQFNDKHVNDKHVNDKHVNDNQFNDKHYKNQDKSLSNQKLEKTTCRFLINSTPMPDIYELYAKSSNSIEKYSYAGVPDIDTSNFLQSILINLDNNDINTKISNNSAIYVECNYHKVFKKWVPFKKADTMDNITNINQIQIILDSL